MLQRSKNNANRINSFNIVLLQRNIKGVQWRNYDQTEKKVRKKHYLPQNLRIYRLYCCIKY